MKIHHLKPADGAHRERTRKGRGESAGKGKTAGRGTKGTGARGSVPAGFEGGQMPLQRRVPKRGFHNPFRKEHATVNVSDLERSFEGGSTVSPKEIRAKGLVKHLRDGLKILGDGKLAKALTVRAHAFTAGAREKIEQAGGRCEVIGE